MYVLYIHACVLMQTCSFVTLGQMKNWRIMYKVCLHPWEVCVCVNLQSFSKDTSGCFNMSLYIHLIHFYLKLFQGYNNTRLQVTKINK